MKSPRPIDEDSAAALVKVTEMELGLTLESERGFVRRQKAEGRKRKAGRK
jgi:hypothetical protein